MFRERTVLVSLVLLLPTSLLATDLSQEKMEFELVQQTEFDKEIKDVAWGETEEGRLYPRIIAFEDEVRFYDEETSLLAPQAHQKYARIRLSVRGNYVGINTVIRHPTKEESGLQKFTVYTEKGEKLWEREEEMEDDYPLYGWCVSSRDGSVVRLDHAAGKLLFLDSKGGEVREVDLFQEMPTGVRS